MRVGINPDGSELPDASSALAAGREPLATGREPLAAGREPAPEGPLAESPLLEISNALVRLYKTAFGRGPTQVRARFAGPDILVVILQNTMTSTERKLVEMGEHERLRQHRQLVRRTVEEEMRGAVEGILERRPVALVSGIDIEHDVAAEVFTLAPLPPA